VESFFRCSVVTGSITMPSSVMVVSIRGSRWSG